MQTPNDLFNEIASAHLRLTNDDLIELSIREYAANEAKMFGKWLLTNTFEPSDMDQLYEKFKHRNETSTNI